MMKLKVSYKNNQICIKSRLGRTEEIDERELQVFSTRLIRGFMHPVVGGKKKISYFAPAGISLQKYLKKGITKKDFFMIVAQVIEATRQIERYGLSSNHLILRLPYTFIHELTKELYFIYQPVSNRNFCSEIFPYLYDIAFHAVFLLEEDVSFANGFAGFMRRMPGYSPAELENYIMRVCPEVYGQIRRGDRGQSRKLDSRICKEAGTTLLKEEETTFLEGEDTTLLERGISACAYLLRVGNYDKAVINKPIFKVGTERGHVDYLVEHNPAVSRLHADIITRENAYYLRDRNSTNHTFVNGKMLEANREQQIFDKDVILLADEAFEFHIEEKITEVQVFCSRKR